MASAGFDHSDEATGFDQPESVRRSRACPYQPWPHAGTQLEDWRN